VGEMSRRIPGEFEKQQGVLLAFPHEGADWPGKYLAVQWAFVEFIKNVSIYESVFLVIRDEKHKLAVKEKLLKAHVDLARIHFILCQTNRSWMRDSGPIIVYDASGEREALDFQFNAWAKYPNYKKDQALPETVARELDIDLVPVIYQGRPVVLEGGAIDYNGEGTLLTTEECLMDQIKQVRNPGFTKSEYEYVFSQYLGASDIIWLGEGIEGDDTHGHVDDICRFVSPGTVILAEEKNGRDYNHRVLEENAERLEGKYLPSGHRLEVVRMPMPGRIDFEGMRLPASYVNFLILNDAVLVPTFNDKNDYLALGILRELMPGRDVIGINATDLIWGLGTLHCLSHEIPDSN